jgi:hypothetical protein
MASKAGIQAAKASPKDAASGGVMQIDAVLQNASVARSSDRHGNRRIASIIVTANAAPKIVANNTSPCDNARPQPKAASNASATNSRKGGSVHGSFISHLF